MLKKKVSKSKKHQISLALELGLVVIIFIFFLVFAWLISKFAWKNFSILLLVTSPLWVAGGTFVFHKLTSRWVSIFVSFICLFPFFFFLIPVFHEKSQCFLSLNEVRVEGEFADQIKIEMDNTDLLKPIYDKYYKKIAKGRLRIKVDKILEFIKLKKVRNWSALDFPLLLAEARKLQEEAKLPAGGDTVFKTNLTTTSKIIVFGDLQGAFPSFARDLLELRKLDLIDDSLKLKNKNDLLVLTGDAVSRSPFQLEHLSLIFRLYLQNPEQFFYLKGHHETDSYWQEFNLKPEINIRLGALFPGQVDGGGNKSKFQDEVDNFFKRLANGIYCELPTENTSQGEKENSKKQQSIEFIRIGPYGAEKIFTKPVEKKLASFLCKKPEGKLFSFVGVNELKEEKNEQEILVKAVIKSEKKRENYQDMDGLRLLAPEDGVPAWTIMSCPTEVYQKGLKFFNDAFCVINIAPRLKDTQIEVHKQDVRTKTGFTTRQANLFSSKEANKEDGKENKNNEVDKGKDLKRTDKKEDAGDKENKNKQTKKEEKKDD